MNANQPIPLLLDGQVGQYYGADYETLPQDISIQIRSIGELLEGADLSYQGKLTASQFASIDVYVYTGCDRKVSVSVMADESGLQGIDCVSKFADESFLTTTTTQIVEGVYEEQKLFRVSFPNLEVLDLLEQHHSYSQSLEEEHGPRQSFASDLMSVAQIVDEYLLRQQSNEGHGFVSLLNAFTIGGMAKQMEEAVNNEDDDDCDDDDYAEPIEYDEENSSPLIRVILQKNLALVNMLLQDKPELNPRGWDKQVPLVAAVYAEDVNVIQTLIAAGANPDLRDMSVAAGPLSIAIKKNRPELVQLLLEQGASPEGTDSSWTAIVLAIQQDSLPMVQRLLEAGADPNANMEDCDRAIMHAASHGNLEIVQCLVENGADVNAWSQGETAIMSAAGGAHQVVYDYLYPLVNDEIRRRANKNGEKDIKRAIAYKARKADKLSEKLGNVAMYGKLEKVKTLIAEGANANAITSCGKSPMMLAAMYGHIAVIKTLLAAGANPNLGCDEEFEGGQTALMYAASSFFANNRAEVVATLIAGGADVDAQDEAGQTALMLSGGRTDAVKALLAANPNVDLRDNEGSTALMLATWAVQKLLRQAGASEIGMHDTDLVKAAYDGNLAKVEVLLQAEASTAYKDGKALVNAAQKGHLKIIERLIQAGTDVNLGWKTGFTPIAAAAYGGWLACVEKLLDAGAAPFQRTFDGDGRNARDYAKLGEREGNYKDREYSAVIERLSQMKNERK